MCQLLSYHFTKESPTRKGSCRDEVNTGPSPIFLNVNPLSSLYARPVDVSTDTETLRLQPQVYANILSLCFNTLMGKIPCSSNVPKSPNLITVSVDTLRTDSIFLSISTKAIRLKNFSVLSSLSLVEK